MSKKTVFGIICLSLMLILGACGLNTSVPKEQNISSEKLTEAEIGTATDTESVNESIAPESDTVPGRESAAPDEKGNPTKITLSGFSDENNGTFDFITEPNTMSAAETPDDPWIIGRIIGSGNLMIKNELGDDHLN